MELAETLLNITEKVQEMEEMIGWLIMIFLSFQFEIFMIFNFSRSIWSILSLHKLVLKDKKIKSFDLKFFFKASLSSDNNIIINAIFNGDSEFAFVEQISFGFKQKVNLDGFMSLSMLILHWGKSQRARHVVDWNWIV